MRPSTRTIMAVAVSVLALLGAAKALLAKPPPTPVPQAPPAPTVSTHVDEARGVVCWVASSPQGLGISCLQQGVASAPAGAGAFGP